MMHFFACDGCWTGFPAVIGLLVAVTVLIGSIYMLLWSNLGARQGYLVLMVGLSAWMILISAMWLFGAPGTTTGTGPRGREALWVPFTPDSQVAKQDFADAVACFPSCWEKVDPKNPKIYPGNISAIGEEINVISHISSAEAALAKKQGLDAIHPAYPGDLENDWAFRDSNVPPAVQGDLTPPAEVFFKQVGGHFQAHLLFGAIIPSVDDALAAKLGTKPHPQVTAFAYRDKGVVFLYALEFLIVFIILFAIHLVLLSRYETTQRKRDEEQAEQTPSEQPALV